MIPPRLYPYFIYRTPGRGGPELTLVVSDRRYPGVAGRLRNGEALSAIFTHAPFLEDDEEQLLCEALTGVSSVVEVLPDTDNTYGISGVFVVLATSEFFDDWANTLPRVAEFLGLSLQTTVHPILVQV